MTMGRLVLVAVFAVTLIQSYGALQVQMPETAEVTQPDDDLQSQIRELQKNVTDIWTYIYDLRNAVSQHLTHLRTHQVALESSVHRMEHLHDGVDDSQSHDHHHSGEHSHSTDHSHGSDHGADHHSHGGAHESDHHSHGSDHGDDHHSHGGDHGSDHDSHSTDHSHGTDHGSNHHSHGSDHSHGGDHGSDHHSHGSDHSHGGDHGSEHHSHSGEHHSHGGDQHSHSGEHGHHSQSHSHSHSSDDHSKEHGSHSHDHSKEDSNHSHSHDSHSHSHGSDHHHDQDHKDSHETEDLSQQTQQVASDSGPVAEPVVTATSRHDHHGHHDHSRGQTGRSAGGRSNSMDLMSEHSFHSHHHGRHHHHETRSKNRTVELPKYADYNMYDFAICDVQPNRAIPVDQQQNVGGQITFWQKKSGGPLNIHVRLQGFQVGDHHGHHGAHQAVQQEEDSEVAPKEAGHRHGFHIHENGDLSNGCQSTGPHYNPQGANHGSPEAMVRHAGDLGSIECDEHGVTNIIFSDDVATLRGQYAISGKSAVIHADQDDKGLGGDAESLKTGNSGVRIACCLIQKVDKLPIRNYKAMKSATQYKNF